MLHSIDKGNGAYHHAEHHCINRSTLDQAYAEVSLY